jgi:DNA-binding transcriptional LysR family regulator
MDRARRIEAFVQVIDAGSFSAAARAMKLSPSAVSKLMSRIEEQLGVRLVDRSTRQLRLTPEHAERREQLLGFRRHHVRVVRAMNQQQRRGDLVGVVDR